MKIIRNIILCMSLIPQAAYSLQCYKVLLSSPGASATFTFVNKLEVGTSTSSIYVILFGTGSIVATDIGNDGTYFHGDGRYLTNIVASGTITNAVYSDTASIAIALAASNYFNNVKVSSSIYSDTAGTAVDPIARSTGTDLYTKFYELINSTGVDTVARSTGTDLYNKYNILQATSTALWGESLNFNTWKSTFSANQYDFNLIAQSSITKLFSDDYKMSQDSTTLQLNINAVWASTPSFGTSAGGGVSVYPATSTIMVPKIESNTTGLNINISSTVFSGKTTFVETQTFYGTTTARGNTWIDGQLRATTSDCYINYLHGNGAWYMAADSKILGEGSAAQGVSNIFMVYQGQQTLRNVPMICLDDTGGTGNQVGMPPLIICGEKHITSDFRVKGSTSPTLMILSNRNIGGYGAGTTVVEYGKFYHDGTNFDIASGSAGVAGLAGGIGIIPSDNGVYYSTWSTTGLDTPIGFNIQASTFTFKNYTTGAGTPTMGTNSPATDATPTYWVEVRVGTTTCYMPAWKK